MQLLVSSNTPVLFFEKMEQKNVKLILQIGKRENEIEKREGFWDPLNVFVFVDFNIRNFFLLPKEN
jgi:hypothetical protein